MARELSLAEKYDIALTFLYGVERVDKIADAKTEDGVISAIMKLERQRRERRGD